MKLTTYDTQDEEKQNKNTTQYVLDTTIHKQTQILGILAFLLTTNLNYLAFKYFYWMYLMKVIKKHTVGTKLDIRLLWMLLIAKISQQDRS